MSHHTHRAILLLLLCVSAIDASAQEKTKIHSNQQWLQYYGQYKLSHNWGLNADGGFRWEDSFKKRLLYISRIGLSYQLNQQLRLATGFANLGSYGGTSLNKLEFRVYQEIFAAYQYHKFGINHRFRLEERYFKKVVDGDVLSSTNFNFRLRYQISATFPLVTFKARDQQLLFHVTDEIFVNAGREIVYNVLDKNRISFGPSFKFSKKITVGLSYMYQFSQLNSPATYANDDVMWFTIRHNVDFSKHSTDKHQ